MEDKVIYLSPSAQEYNIGYGDFGSEEYRMNRIADLVEKMLKNQGYTVYRNNPNEKLSQIVRESNEINPDIHVALHSNASGDGFNALLCSQRIPFIMLKHRKREYSDAQNRHQNNDQADNDQISCCKCSLSPFINSHPIYLSRLCGVTFRIITAHRTIIIITLIISAAGRSFSIYK